MKRLTLIATLIAAGCLASPPEGPLVEGPTLAIEIPSLSQAQIVGNVLLAAAPLGDEAQMAQSVFLATNAGVITPKQPVALRGARVRLRPGNGVDDLADVFDGLMIFVAPERDPMTRVFVASAVAPASAGPVELDLIASRQIYEDAQAAIATPRFIVGVSGPTALAPNAVMEFGIRVELDMAIFEDLRTGGHGRPH